MADQKWLLDRADIGRLPGEREEAWYQRVEDTVRAAADPGILALWRERAHALVRSELRRTRRARLATAIVCAILPYMIFPAMPLADLLGGNQYKVWLAGLFPCLWPLAMFLCAMLRAAGSVAAERERDTAMQLALTPVPRRLIAAARVLPAVEPFLWGMLGALPIYLLVGEVHDFTIWRWPPNFLALWPLRMLAPLDGFDASGRIGLLGFANGLFMWLTDLGLIWAAAHWGAAYAVRLGKLGLATMFCAGRLALTALWLMICAIPSVIVGLLPFAGLMLLQALYKHAGLYESASRGGILYWTAVVLGLAGGLFVFGLLFRRLVVGAVRLALVEFAWFDRLADDEFTPRLREALPWAIMLDPTARR